MDQLTNDDPRALGPYRMIGRLGAGGMGRVLYGIDARGDHVACKIVHPELASDPGFRERFRREVRMARAAPQWFTAGVLDADPEAEPPWLATEFVDGPSLRARVGTGGPLARDELTVLAGRLATGLAALHRGGLVHRDIKPSNILLSRAGPRLIDFGIARAADQTSLTVTGHVLGTPAYMSPEQVTGSPVDAPSDVFSLGAVLTYAGTGRSPFEATSTAAELYRVAHEAPDLGWMSGPLRALVSACLDKDAARRPTADQLRMALVENDPRPTVAPSTPVAAQAGATRLQALSDDRRPDGPWWRGRRVQIGATAAVVAVLLAGGALLVRSGATASSGAPSGAATAPVPASVPAGTPAPPVAELSRCAAYFVQDPAAFQLLDTAVGGPEDGLFSAADADRYATRATTADGATCGRVVAQDFREVDNANRLGGTGLDGLASLDDLKALV